MFPIIDSQKTGEKIKLLMEQKNISSKDVQNFLSLSCVQTVYRWINGITVPSIDNLYALSYLLGVPIDEIVCGNRESFEKNYLVKENGEVYQMSLN
ncbi:helix-turn-helix transcriptional regulator [Thomasclavelia sp.]|uniref:helix-turn-helix domain-containing protein n=1 Tax=Thomasclavelia sp. TaxID=3025757 RepID=UPI0025DED4D4|nr:helix-turn-helix transcriptional regulator [Thomasclavelia sp.]